MGLVHDVAPADEIVARAKAWVKANPGAKAPWDDPKFKAPSGKVFSPAGMMIWPPANAISAPRDLRQLSRRQGDPGQRVRGPATADRPRAGGREPLLRQDPALEGSGGDDPLAVHLQGRARQGRAPARRRRADQLAQDRRARRRLHGRRDRLCRGERRARGRADRPRPGIGRQGQGAFGEADLQPDRQGPRQERRPRRAAGAHPRRRPTMRR